MQCFAHLTEPNKLNVQPRRLQIVRADRTASFQDLIAAELPRDFDPQSVAIMNQIQLVEIVSAGRQIKKIR